MDLQRLVVHDVKDRIGSLAMAMEALLRWAGANVRYRDLNAALGLSLRTTAVRGNACLGWWSTHGCDAFLVETARLYGVRLRALHPPEAAVGLSEHEPFGQHFDASYAPLVRRALEHGQPVIAWQGWPDARAWLWGLITHTRDEGVGFGGTTMWSHGETVLLASPPVQLYVVEEIAPRELSDHELFDLAVRGFRNAADDSAAADSNVVTGETAYDLWLERLEKDEVCPTCGNRGGRCHLQHARFLSSHRATGVRFFEHYRDGADETLQPLFDALAANCKGPINALTTSRDPQAVDKLVKTAQGRAALAVGVRAARSFDIATAEEISRLTNAIT